MTPEYIIVHHSLSRDQSMPMDWPELRDFHMRVRGWDDVGYHYGVELVNGHPEALVGRFMNVKGAHSPPMNDRSLGVCVVGDFTRKAPPLLVWNFTTLLVASLCDVLDISTGKVLGHREVQVGRTCPGAAFDMDAFRTAVGSVLVTNAIGKKRVDYMNHKERTRHGPTASQ